MKKRIADIIIEILEENNVKDCFCVVGGGSMHLNNAFSLSKNIKTYFNHHEQACTMAAEAYSRLSGKLAAVCVTSGPGGTNALTGVLGAWQDSLPILVLSGQVRYETTVEYTGLDIRYRGIQEFDIIKAVQGFTKYAKIVKDPLSIKSEIQKAIDISLSGRKGPVWIDIPLDIQSKVVEETDLYNIKKDKIELASPTNEDIETLVNKINSSERPCILAGSGIRISGSLNNFRNLIKKWDIPILSAAYALDILNVDHYRYYGMAGMLGPRAGNLIIQNADVILSLGTSMGFKLTGFAQEHFAPNAKVIYVDIDKDEALKPGLKIDTFIESDLNNFFGKIFEKDHHISVSQEWLDYCDNLKSKFSIFNEKRETLPNDRVSAYEFWKKYEIYEPEDNISVLGNNTGNSAKLQVGVKKPLQRALTNVNCGSMGYDLPAAIGAAVSQNKPVVCITGEGSIMMNLQELQTIVKNNLPIKIIIFSNDGYGAIKQTSKNFFNGNEFGCSNNSGISFPDFEKIANAFEFKYISCDTNSEIEKSLKLFFSFEKLVILEVKQAIDDPILPKVMSRINKDGTFSTPAIHDMYPFLEKKELEDLTFWEN